jgi:hypothetical protein
VAGGTGARLADGKVHQVGFEADADDLSVHRVYGVHVKHFWTMAGSLSLVAACLWGTLAKADEIRGPVVTSDGFVLIAVERPGDGSALEQRIAVPTEALAIHQGMKAFQAQPVGECHEIEIQIQRDGTEHSTRTRRCPTAEGWSEKLIESSLYEHYEVYWTFYREEGLTQLQWELKARIPGVAPIVLNYHLGEAMRLGLRSLGAKE